MDPIARVLDGNILQTMKGRIDPNVSINGSRDVKKLTTTRAEEIISLVQRSLEQLTPFIMKADQERETHRTNRSLPPDGTVLINALSLQPETLRSQLAGILKIHDDGSGVTGFEDSLQAILDFSVNPTAPGFMDKLYSAPVPPGIAAELILGVLNANLHVYHVSPVLTLIEKNVTKQLAALFGLNGPRAGGISVNGGSASNLTSIVVARNSLFPDTKTMGNSAGGRRLVMFASAHGHYSIEKAAQALGFGTSAVIPVPTDSLGRMKPDDLDRLIRDAKAQGETPFYISATAGTTVLGSFDPFEEIAAVAKKHRCWFHIDGAWGGSFIFSQRDDVSKKLQGSHLADSIAINPHKMMGVPVTCSVLLTRDLRLFQEAMTLKAGYLFHESEEDDDDDDAQSSSTCYDEIEAVKDVMEVQTTNSSFSLYDLRDEDDPSWVEPDDLADMTLQCGRKGDSLKLFMAWQYYGTAGYAAMIENAFDVAKGMAVLVDASDDLTLVLGPGSEPNCLQVCFYYTPNRTFLFGLKGKAGTISHRTARSKNEIGKQNTRVTSRISKALVPKGFMVDFAPALDGQEDKGSFLRVVVNISTMKETAVRLIQDIHEVGNVVVKELQAQFSNDK